MKVYESDGPELGRAAARIALPCGRSFSIDDADLHFLDGRIWFSRWSKGGNRNLHVRGRPPGVGKKEVGLARLILGLKKGEVVDFKNLNGLDCRRENIRKTSRAIGNRHVPKKRKHKKYKGVFFDRRRGKFYAQIAVDRRRYYGGNFDDPQLAAAAYDLLAVKHHKEFALTNEMQSAKGI